ncbi:MAG: PHP domain-containing protein [Pseudomonadota bacterium]
MTGLIDLHTHSIWSDGTLAPAALVELASQRKLEVLALTDHDTTLGLAEARAACATAGIGFVTGVEITSGWRGQEIHVVGLGVDPDSAALQTHLSQLVQLRRDRIVAIGARLQRDKRFAQIDLAAQVLDCAPVPTRMHLARSMVAIGATESTQQAFDRYLGRGCVGHVAQEWPTVEAAIVAIRAAGGHAVLAHAHRYKLSGGALRNLCAEFAGWGGSALEVSLPGLSPGDASRLASLARQHSLAGSAASDFHEPGVAWRPLGRFAKLADGIEPLLARLKVA